MFALNGDHIAKLDDTDLRSLVFRLCEAELRRLQLPTSAVTAGGNQNAADGGVDVRVELTGVDGRLDFIPRPLTGFQVKRSDMPPSKITPEMRPAGRLRESIQALLAAGGAYVIVSSQGSAADSALQDRRDAMVRAATDCLNVGGARLEFYDRDRLANWVNNYPGVALWVRERIGEPLSEWHGYGNWSADLPDCDYLHNDTGRVHCRGTGSNGLVSVTQAIVAMRAAVARPGGVVRLVGLSGTGKTRLVQALFDARIGTDALDRSIVAYTDQGREPDPPARDMLRRLGANAQRAIVVVDNCNPDMHRALTQIVREHSAALSLITVEHDVAADDEPEETQVFELIAASDDVLVGIVQRHAPFVSFADQTRIAEFSGGNSRVALALAATLKRGGSLGVLNDTALLKRLFGQDTANGDALMRAAEACSLFYSFDGETLDGTAAELPLLAEIADISPRQLYRHIVELQRRNLVQRRGRWRAVLPQAVANRLAQQALRNTPFDPIEKVLTRPEHNRLLRSFSRRLGFLHGSEEACAIANRWMKDSRWLADLSTLGAEGIAMFHNIAPLVPERVLTTIEAATRADQRRAFLRPDAPEHARWLALLRSLAFEPSLFDRAAWILVRIAATESADQGSGPARDAFLGLFRICLSGTHAPVEQRVEFIRALLAASDPSLPGYGIEALDEMLKTSHFAFSHSTGFGARSRDFGWAPVSDVDIQRWYRSALAVMDELIAPASMLRDKARAILARHFRQLWHDAGVQPELERIAQTAATQDGWFAGWIAIRLTLQSDSQAMPSEQREHLGALERALRPQGLIQIVRAYVLSRNYRHLDLIEQDNQTPHKAPTEATLLERLARVLEGIAKELVAEPDVFRVLLADLLQSGPGQHWVFGRALALATHDVQTMWRQMRDVLLSIAESQRNVALLCGFVNAAAPREPAAVGALLNAAVTDPLLAPYFPLLQSACLLDEPAVRRLLAATEAGIAPAWTYSELALGRASDCIAPSSYEQLLLRIAGLPDGMTVAVRLLSMRLHSSDRGQALVDQPTLALGRALLGMFTFQVNDDDIDYHLSKIAEICLSGHEASACAVALARNYLMAVRNGQTWAWRFDELICALFRLQPVAALDVLLGAGNTQDGSLVNLCALRGTSAVNCADPQSLLSWARVAPADRIPKLAGEIEVITMRSDGEPDWSALASALLSMAPNRQAVLDQFSRRLHPRAWSGSLADALRPCRTMLSRLARQADPLVADWARRQEEALAARIKQDDELDRQSDERFE